MVFGRRATRAEPAADVALGRESRARSSMKLPAARLLGVRGRLRARLMS